METKKRICTLAKLALYLLVGTMFASLKLDMPWQAWVILAAVIGIDLLSAYQQKAVDEHRWRNNG